MTPPPDAQSRFYGPDMEPDLGRLEAGLRNRDSGGSREG